MGVAAALREDAEALLRMLSQSRFGVGLAIKVDKPELLHKNMLDAAKLLSALQAACWIITCPTIA